MPEKACVGAQSGWKRVSSHDRPLVISKNDKYGEETSDVSSPIWSVSNRHQQSFIFTPTHSHTYSCMHLHIHSVVGQTCLQMLFPTHIGNYYLMSWILVLIYVITYSRPRLFTDTQGRKKSGHTLFFLFAYADLHCILQQIEGKTTPMMFNDAYEPVFLVWADFTTPSFNDLHKKEFREKIYCQ